MKLECNIFISYESKILEKYLWSLKMFREIFLLIILVFFTNIVFSQNRENERLSGSSSLDIGFANSGLSFGNSQNWNGLRFNISDENIEEINGINITFWKPENVKGSVVNGISFGLAPSAGEINGLALGIGNVADKNINGINLGVLASVSGGEMVGLNYGGLALVAEGDITGINFGGLAQVAQGGMAGFNFGGLALVSEGSVLGINIGGLAQVSQAEISGINLGGLALVSEAGIYGASLGGLALVSQQEITGVNIGGLALVSEDEITGINIGGLAIASQAGIMGLNLSLGSLISEGEISGISFGGYKSESLELTGNNISIGWTEIDELNGFSIAGYNQIYKQNGLTIGLVNFAEILNGIQIGLVNIAENNPVPFKVVPFINANF
jgi:hypothetical protein